MTRDPDALRDALAGLTRYAMVGNLTDRHMQAVSDGEYVRRSDVIAALDRSDPAAGLREAIEGIDLGVYPAASPAGPRTPWQDGWNQGGEDMRDAVLALLAATPTPSPTAGDLRGLVPNLTGGLSSEEYVRRIRDDAAIPEQDESGS